MPSGGVATGAGGTARQASDSIPALPIGAGVLAAVLLAVGGWTLRRSGQTSQT